MVLVSMTLPFLRTSEMTSIISLVRQCPLHPPDTARVVTFPAVIISAILQFHSLPDPSLASLPSSQCHSLPDPSLASLPSSQSLPATSLPPSQSLSDTVLTAYRCSALVEVQWERRLRKPSPPSTQQPSGVSASGTVGVNSSVILHR